MDENAIKFIYLAVGIFISLAIVTGLMISLNAYKQAFDIVESSSMGLKGEFIELEKYNGATLKGIDVLNTVKKYAEDDYISVVVDFTGAQNLEFNAKTQTDDAYNNKIEILRNYLNKSTLAGLSYYNKEFRFEVEGLERNMEKIEGPVVIKVREV